VFHTAHDFHLITRKGRIRHFVGNSTVVWMSEMEQVSSFPKIVSRSDWSVVASCLLFSLPHDPHLYICIEYQCFILC